MLYAQQAWVNMANEIVILSADSQYQFSLQ